MQGAKGSVISIHLHPLSLVDTAGSSGLPALFSAANDADSNSTDDDCSDHHDSGSGTVVATVMAATPVHCNYNFDCIRSESEALRTTAGLGPVMPTSVFRTSAALGVVHAASKGRASDIGLHGNLEGKPGNGSSGLASNNR